MTLAELNKLPLANAAAELFRCCAGPQWVASMMNSRPFNHNEEVLQKAEQFWADARYRDVMAAFAGHPKIGDKEKLTEKFPTTAEWASDEQKGVDNAADEVIDKLAEGNIAYEKKFGYIFIVCATGKTAKEMLGLLNGRINNLAAKEYDIAKVEQLKITKLRLEKLLS